MLKGLDGYDLEQAFYRARIQDVANDFETVLSFGNSIGFNRGYYINLILGKFRPVTESTRTIIEQMPGRESWFSPEAAY